MLTSRFRVFSAFFLLLALSSMVAFQPPVVTSSRLADPFSTGWMLSDTNGDGVVDFVAGKVVVPASPSAAENAAAADIAARIGFGSTGLTPPAVISAAEDRGDGPRIYVGRGAVPSRMSSATEAQFNRLQADEGGVFAVEANIAVLGHDDAGLLAAAQAFAARAPFIWRVPGERLGGIAGAVDQAASGARASLTGVTYLKEKIGIHRAFLQAAVPVAASALQTAVNGDRLANVHELSVTANGSTESAVSSKAMAAIPPAPPAGTGPDAAAGGGDAEGAGPARLDLATLYTMRGLFRGTPRMPIPSNLDAQLYVPAGREGIAMANLAARMGLETTGITLPLATPSTSAAVRDIRTKSVVVENSDVGKEAARKLRDEDTVHGQSESSLAAGEGELRVVDRAFGRQPAVLVRGDDSGASAALGLLSDHLPNLWEAGKQHLSIEEIRYDLHRFFSLRSSAGQASVALYRLNKWAEEIKKSGTPRNVEAKVYVDIAEPGLKDLVRGDLEKRLGVTGVKVEAASLHAGTQCCEKLPALHYREPGYTFHQGTPAFQEDIVIPWEGSRLVKAVKDALPKLKQGEPVKLLARVSEGPEARQKLKKQIQDMLPKSSTVEVLSAYKPGVSWLMDSVAPQLKGKALGSLRIEFKRNQDPTHTRAMFSPARWVQELYPVDEMLANELSLPLEKIELDEFEPGPNAPTYRAHAYDKAGKEILTREFTVTTVDRPYNGVMPEYEKVQVDTGWVRMESGSTAVLDQRIATDIEEFWDHYHKETLPKVFRTVMASYHGELRPEFAPPFDTLKIDIHMSEPNYELGVDKERISSLEALQEDTFYSTENFVNMMGDLMVGRSVTYVGRIIPIVHASDDGKDGHVHIEFYSKPAGSPSVELAWTDAQGKRHEQKRDLWVLQGAMQPRLIQARVAQGSNGPESLTWLMPADFKDDQYAEWVNVEGKDQVERSIFPAEQARGQLRWIEAMHSAGLYKNDLAYPHLRQIAFEFEMPLPLTAKVESATPREYVALKIAPPASPRPMIGDFAKDLGRSQTVQWDEPIPPSENAAVLAHFAKSPGVNVYWMGRSYLGENLWAADVTLPTPSVLRSPAKETTLKASIVYSGRQHANEVSSTSHILKLGDQLLNDAATRALLKQVNVILHPITNTDGAELSVQLAEITPNNMLHPGYHGALAADVANGQTDFDPVYPESRTRRQLLEAWLPDAFLNPHGYPSHEWVQPFSEYSGWVQSRQGANNGRTWWIPRGWFTSLAYLRDDTHPYSEKVIYELQDRIVEAERGVPGLLDLEARMNARYQRFGQRWQPDNMQQPIVNGIRIYMGLKGAGGGRGGAGGQVAPGSGGVGGISPDVTWDSGYTEAPDETAHGEYMKLMASAGLAFDRAHLEYLAKGKLRINRTEREQGGKVTWRIERLRPNLPGSETEPSRRETATEGSGNQNR
ncbi:MAG TPA: M14 family zinc carboxypeptidase [Bryobacteraceae bacterium]|nr:M14 family zinc carboxypeptidase [Bryobacteraceae bacterium]